MHQRHPDIWLWINTYENTIFRGMNIHKSQLFWCSPGVPGFWDTAISWYIQMKLDIARSSCYHHWSTPGTWGGFLLEWGTKLVRLRTLVDASWGANIWYLDSLDVYGTRRVHVEHTWSTKKLHHHMDSHGDVAEKIYNMYVNYNIYILYII